MMNSGFDLDSAIRKVSDFPSPGVLFYDLTGILNNPLAFAYCLDRLAQNRLAGAVDIIAGVEARGFVFAAPLALRLGLPLLLVRKKGKLPGKTIGKRFALEYGEAEIEIHPHDLKPGQRVWLIDDLIATGGTIKAAAELIEEGGARIAGISCVVGLPFLDYSDRLSAYQIDTLINYENE